MKYSSAWNHGLDHRTLTIARNEFLCILGSSGCGKNTLLMIVAGRMRQSRDEELLNGKPINAPGLDRGIVFQDPALFAWLLLMGGWKKPAARDRRSVEFLTMKS